MKPGHQHLPFEGPAALHVFGGDVKGDLLELAEVTPADHDRSAHQVDCGPRAAEVLTDPLATRVGGVGDVALRLDLQGGLRAGIVGPQDLYRLTRRWVPLPAGPALGIGQGPPVEASGRRSGRDGVRESVATEG